MRNNDLTSLFNNQTENTDSPASVKSSLDYVMPTELVELPSKGKLYPVGHPLRDKTTIEIKQMTAKEEDILTSESFIKNGVVLEKFLNSIIVDKSIKGEDLVVADRSAIYLAARILAYGPEYVIDLICPKCREQKSHTYDLMKFPKIKKLQEEAAVSDQGTISLSLPVTNWKVELRSVFGKDENTLFDRKNSADSLITSQILSMVVSINDVTDKELLKKAVEVMPVKDTKFLRTKYKENMPSVTFPYAIECKKCNHSEELEAPITLEFFWPKQ